MKHVSYKTIIQISILGAISLLIACQKGGGRLNAQTAKPTNKPSIIEEKLVPTLDINDYDEPIVRNGVTYQAPPKKIRNKNNNELLIGRVKMERTIISYDPNSREMKISGVAHILSENKKSEIGVSEFNINGIHKADEIRFLLKDPAIPKMNSSEKPLVRAKATCLSIDANDNYDCSRAVIDFFIAYKREVFTEQMELIPKSVAPQAPSTEDKSPGNSDSNNIEELQSEGIEESIEGRYEGQAEVADLTVVFDGDQGEPILIQEVETPSNDEDPSVIPVSPGPVVTPTTPAVPTTQTPTSTPSKPPVKTPAQPPTSPVTKPPSTGDKKEKPLNKDLQQLSNGDVRQINQAIGFPDQGSLRNATSLYTKQQAFSENSPFEIVSPSRNRHFGTYEMAEFISRLGTNLVDIYNHKLFVGNISQKSGGKLSPHKSHQIGIDVDIGYPTTKDSVKFPVVVQMSTRQYNPSSYSVEKTFETLKFAFNQQDIKIDRIFMDRTIKKSLCDYAKSKNEFNSKDKDLVNKVFNSIDHVDGHGDHFHVRLRCSSYDPACRNRLYSINKGCN